MEALVLALLGLILSGHTALWYKIGKVEVLMRHHINHHHQEDDNA